MCINIISHTGRDMALFAHDYCRNFKLRQLFVERNTNAHSDVLLELCMVKSGTLCIDGFDLRRSCNINNSHCHDVASI